MGGGMATLKERRTRLEKRLARIRDEESRLRQAERKREARAKIILGGALVSAARTDAEVADLVRALVGRMKNRERVAVVEVVELGGLAKREPAPKAAATPAAVTKERSAG